MAFVGMGFGAAASLKPYVAHAVELDGTNDWLSTTSGLTGAADSGKVTFSCWINKDAVDSFKWLYDSYGFEIYFIFATLNIKGVHQSGSSILDVSLTSAITAGSWFHIIFSCDLSSASKRHLYINNSATSPDYSVYSNSIFDFTTNNHAICAGAASGGNTFDGGVSDFWLSFGTYIDISVEDNLRKFIDAEGKPVFLGATGELPTGASPILFFSGETDSWHTNKGTGGGFTENGALTTATSSPSD